MIKTKAIQALTSITVAGIVLLAVAQVMGHGAAEEETNQDDLDARRPVHVLIGFDNTPGPTEHALVEAHGGVILDSFWLTPAIWASISPGKVKALASHPEVRYVQADVAIVAEGTGFQEPARQPPWNLARVFGGEPPAFAPAWAGTGQAPGVAVLDTGIDASHPALEVQDLGASTVSFYPDWESDPRVDPGGMGTYMAGLIAGFGNPRTGLAPGVNLHSVRVMTPHGLGTHATVIAGLQWAVEHEIPIITMSFGHERKPCQALREACDAAYRAGHLLIAPSGHGGNPFGMDPTVMCPARYGSVMAVAASGTEDTRWKHASMGPEVELIAPGAGVVTTAPSGEYARIDWTSAAVAHVAGAAALVWGANPDLTNEEVRATLRDTAEDLGLDPWEQGHGLLRADRAIAAANAQRVLAVQTRPKSRTYR